VSQHTTSWSPVAAETLAALPPPPISVEQTAQTFRLATSQVSLEGEASSGRWTFHIKRADGSDIVEHLELFLDSEEHLTMQAHLAGKEHFFGAGLRTGNLDHRGKRLTCWATDPLPPHDGTTDAMYQSVPFISGLRDGVAYGLYVDSTWKTTLDLGATAPTMLSCSTDGPDLVVYLCAGPSLADVMQQYTTLTGRMPSLPRWTLGFHQSRWSYQDEAEVRAIAVGLREHRIPCDAVWLDIDYMRGYRNFTWDGDRFSKPAELIAALRDQGLHTMVILDPGVKVDADYAVYQDAIAHGFVVQQAGGTPFEGWCWPGKAVWPDFAHPDVRAWWGEQHRALFALGVAGIWNDMNEPSQTDLFVPADVEVSYGATLPGDTQHRDETASWPHAAFHNAYGTQMARATRTAWEHSRPDERPFILTRAAGAGAQSYTAVWTGDNTSSWEHLRLAISENLGISLSGFPMTGSDIGGFWENTTPELLVRFTQLGAFLPLNRNHSALGTIRQEPWAFGEPYTALCRQAIERRYQLLPYFVTLAHEASLTGAPIIRPLAWVAPEDEACISCSDQLLLGNDILVAPVVYEGATERKVVLPAGMWCDMDTGNWHQGPDVVMPVVDLASTPRFARSGAIIPLAGVTQHTAESATEPLTLHVYLGSPEMQMTTVLWDDDDHPQAEQHGTFATYDISCDWTGERIIVRMNHTRGTMSLRYPGLRVALHLPQGYIATAVTTNETLPLFCEWHVSLV
jgi:alpha-glucosidase